MTLFPWTRRRLLTWDVTCVHRLAASWRAASTADGTPAADTAETRKIDKYRDLCAEYIFQPIAFETLGGFGTSSYRFIKSLGSRIASATSDSDAARHLRQRLSMAVQIGNAAAVLESFNTYIY